MAHDASFADILQHPLLIDRFDKSCVVPSWDRFFKGGSRYKRQDIPEGLCLTLLEPLSEQRAVDCKLTARVLVQHTLVA